MNTLILIKFWREVIIALLVIALSLLLFAYEKRGHTIEQIQTEHELEFAEMRALHNAEVRAIENQRYNEVINAIKESEKRQQEINIDVESANRANERLHKTVDNINTSIANENAKARADYTASISKIFKECTTEYLEVAKRADGHANDVRMMYDAWGD